MKEKPIIFSPVMARAIRRGDKTVTRRLVKPQPETYQGETELQFEWPGWNGSANAEQFAAYCPYGAVGDRLWVRETWADLRGGGFDSPFAYLADSIYDDGIESGESQQAREDYGYKWRPSIFMPRLACRTVLEITQIKVERLREITAADVVAEGVRVPVITGQSAPGKALPLIRISGPYPTISYLPDPNRATEADFYRAEFASKWDQINGKTCPWATDPWIWAVNFKVTEHATAVDGAAA